MSLLVVPAQVEEGRSLRLRLVREAIEPSFLQLMQWDPAVGRLIFPKDHVQLGGVACRVEGCRKTSFKFAMAHGLCDTCDFHWQASGVPVEEFLATAKRTWRCVGKDACCVRDCPRPCKSARNRSATRICISSGSAGCRSWTSYGGRVWSHCRRSGSARCWPATGRRTTSAPRTAWPTATGSASRRATAAWPTRRPGAGLRARSRSPARSTCAVCPNYWSQRSFLVCRSGPGPGPRPRTTRSGPCVTRPAASRSDRSPRSTSRA
ncbi:hypothetical protein QF035_010937 [Streptomyces umbrinus]|uniref:Uncharacterized protein n=1 Tax=Streptomyces umbrinus TaxID=67370 RepID=A0ABU0TC13_9ACTN|nr:hypothetical protein [Streptomyces umbrinus]